jgi:hypothetical protein
LIKNKYSILNTQYPIPNTQYPILNGQYPIPNAQYPMSNTRCPIPDTRFRNQWENGNEKQDIINHALLLRIFRLLKVMDRDEPLEMGE